MTAEHSRMVSTLREHSLANRYVNGVILKPYVVDELAAACRAAVSQAAPV